MTRRKLDRNQLSFCCWLFCVFTVLSLAGLVAWLSLIPKDPIFTVSEAQFPAPDSYNHSTHGNTSLPNKPLIFNLEIFNPNKRMGIYYSDISMELYSNGGGVIGRNSTPGFYQGHKNTTMIRMMIQTNREIRQAANGGNQDFVRVKTGVVFRIIRWKTKLRQIACDEHFSKDGINLNAGQQNASRIKIRN